MLDRAPGCCICLRFVGLATSELIAVLSCREKKLLASSEDYGKDLTGVQNLRKKHQRLEAEMNSHEPRIQVRTGATTPVLLLVCHARVVWAQIRRTILVECSVRDLANDRGNYTPHPQLYPLPLLSCHTRAVWAQTQKAIIAECSIRNPCSCTRVV